MRLKQLFCPHEDVIRRTDGPRLFVSCMRCGTESPGIVTGGFRYNHTLIKERSQAVARSFRPRRIKR